MKNPDHLDVLYAAAVAAVPVIVAMWLYFRKRPKLVDLDDHASEVTQPGFLTEKIIEWAKNVRRYRPFRFSEVAIAFPEYDTRTLRQATKTLLYKGHLRQNKAGWMKVN